ncbi:MAG: regulatory protein RecX [Anaerovoracaceae bacterium]|jgi:regulatory protein
MGLNARDLALKYLSRRDRTAMEIKKYLELKGVSEEEIRDCLDYLSECGLIDDEEYCEKYISYGMEKGRGPIRLEKELLERGVSPEVVKLALEAHFSDGAEQKAALAYINKLLEQTGREIAGNDKEMAKIGRRLAYQGYHSNVIYDLLNKLRR